MENSQEMAVDPTDIAINQGEGGAVEVRLGRESVWLNQEQTAQLFGRERSVIGKHVRNVFADGELDEESNVQNLHIAGSDKLVRFYHLDVIISVGYRVKSLQGTRFRQWATSVLRQHLTQGYTLNRQRLEANARELKTALRLVHKLAQSPELPQDAGRGLLDVVTRYVRTFLLLQRYDEGLLTDPPQQSGGTLPTVDEARGVLGQLKADLRCTGARRSTCSPASAAMGCRPCWAIWTSRCSANRPTHRWRPRPRICCIS
ncbi:MAG: virulence RhuM family protein [Ottowia sp.]|nr:virulence RhuM family protein [Ottowia sp.]